MLKMSNDASGAKGVLISLDQGGTEIPVSAIDQKDSKLMLLVKMVGGQYEAEINKEGSELNGTWTQGGNGLPLKHYYPEVGLLATADPPVLAKLTCKTAWYIRLACGTIGQGSERDDKPDHRSAGRPGAQP